MTREQARREIDDLDYYLQHHTDDYSESSHTAMMMAISALDQNGMICEWAKMTHNIEDDEFLFEFSDGTVRRVKQAMLEQFDAISRDALMREIHKLYQIETVYEGVMAFDTEDVVKAISDMPQLKTIRWIPVSERLPENNDPVNITWVNHNPEHYYEDIKDETFTATGHYHNGKWFWFSATCQDYLDEYGYSDVDAIDENIEIIAWMPLPEPYKDMRGAE